METTHCLISKLAHASSSAKDLLVPLKLLRHRHMWTNLSATIHLGRDCLATIRASYSHIATQCLIEYRNPSLGSRGEIWPACANCSFAPFQATSRTKPIHQSYNSRFAQPPLWAECPHLLSLNIIAPAAELRRRHCGQDGMPPKAHRGLQLLSFALVRATATGCGLNMRLKQLSCVWPFLGTPAMQTRPAPKDAPGSPKDAPCHGVRKSGDTDATKPAGAF